MSAVLVAREAGHREHPVARAPRARSRGTPFRRAKKSMFSLDRELVVEREQLRHVADAALDRARSRRSTSKPATVPRPAVGAAGRTASGSWWSCRRRSARGSRRPRRGGRRSVTSSTAVNAPKSRVEVLDLDHGAVRDRSGRGRSSRVSAARPPRRSATRSMNTSSSEGSMRAALVHLAARGAQRRARRGPPPRRRRPRRTCSHVAEHRRARDAGQRRRGLARRRARGRRGRPAARPASVRLQRARRVERHDAPAVQQREAVEALGLVHVGGADDRRHAARAPSRGR